MKNQDSQKIRKLVALSYEFGSADAPQVCLNIAGSQVEQALAIARKYGISIQQDKPLTEALSKVEIDEFIPQSLYRAVAIVLRKLTSTA